MKSIPAFLFILSSFVASSFVSTSSYAGDYENCKKAGRKDPNPRDPLTVSQGKNNVLLVRAKCKAKSGYVFTTIVCPCQVRSGQVVCEENLQKCYESFVRDSSGEHLHDIPSSEYTMDEGTADGDTIAWTPNLKPYRVKIPDGSEINVGDALVTSPPIGTETIACNSASVSSAAGCANDPSTSISDDRALRADLNSVGTGRKKSKAPEKTGGGKGVQGN